MLGFSSEGGWSSWQVGCERSSAAAERTGNLKLHISSSSNPDPIVSKRIEFNIHCTHKSHY